MKKLYEENDIQSIAAAIRNKNGTQNKYKVNQMAEAIENLQVGDSGDNPMYPPIEQIPAQENEWIRPDEWPDLDALPLPTDGTNCVYLTIDNTVKGNNQATRFYHTGSNDTLYIDYGYVDESGNYIVNSTQSGSGTWTSDNHFFTASDVDYPVIRLRADNAATIKQSGTAAITAANSNNGIASAGGNSDVLPVLQVVGTLPTITSLTGASNNPAYGGRFCKRIKLTALNKITGNMSYAFQHNTICQSIVLLSDVNKIRPTNVSYMFNNCRQIKNIDISCFSFSSTTTFSNMFNSCRKLQTIMYDKWAVTSKCTALNSLFTGCNYLTFNDKQPFNEWDTSKVTTMANVFESCNSITSIDISNWNISQVTSMASLFYLCISMKTVKLPVMPAPKLTNISTMFYSCYSLEGEIDLSSWQLQSINICCGLFNTCRRLSKINLGNAKFTITSTATSNAGFNNLFNNCNNLKQIIWDMSRCDCSISGNMNGIYSNCYNLETPLDWSWYHGSENCLNFNSFNGLYKVPSITFSNNVALPKVNTTASMFYNCQNIKSLDLSGFTFGPLTTLSAMFSGCYQLQELKLPIIDTSKVTTIDGVFRYCWNLKEIPQTIKNWDLSVCTTIGNAFAECKRVKEFDLSSWKITTVTKTFTSLFQNCFFAQKIDCSNWNISASTTWTSLFNQCRAKEINLTGWSHASSNALIPNNVDIVEWYPAVTNVAHAINVMFSLSNESLQRLADTLPKRTSAAAITMGIPISRRLTAAQIATITQKGWTIA